MLGTASSGAIGEKVVRSRPAAGARDGGHDAPTSAPGSRPQPNESRMNRIARRAHEIYEARGGEHGKAMEDWLQAEREVDAEIEAPRNTEGLADD